METACPYLLLERVFDGQADIFVGRDGRRFTATVMAQNYLALYETLLLQKRHMLLPERMGMEAGL